MDHRTLTAHALASPCAQAYNFWPTSLQLGILKGTSPESAEFDYAKAFSTLDLGAVKQDIFDIMKTSQDWCGPPTTATKALIPLISM